MKLESRIEEIIEPVISNLGFELEYVEFVKEGTNNVLRVVVDKPNESMWVDDCEKVSRLIEDIIDNEVSKEYVLEVSSPGLERQIKNIKLYKKYTGKEICIKLYKKIEDKKEIIGTLKEVDENNNTIVIILDKEDIKLELKEIATANTVYDFNLALKGNTDNINLNKLNKFNK